MSDSIGEESLSTAPPELRVGSRRMVIYAEGAFTPLDAKTAVCLVRFATDEVVAVIDSSRAPTTTDKAIGFGGDIPVVADLEEALAFEPNSLVIGMAPRGGMLPDGAYDVIRIALSKGFHIISGMHRFLSDDETLSNLARENNAVIWDVRKPPGGLGVSSGNQYQYCPVALKVGSDCNTGKMTAGMIIYKALLSKGVKASFAASGQTGIMITGRGIPVDRVISDFVGGATERLVLESAAGKDVVLLEGQGSILHPGYAGVTIGMIAGALPHAMILCHQPSRKVIRNYTIPIPPLDKLVELYENAIPGIMKIPVIGVSLNTFDLTDSQARQAISEAEEITGLPVADPVRYGPDSLVEAIIGLIESS